MERNFENKYEYAIDLLDNYSNMVNDGHKLSVQQRKQIMEILSFLQQTDANDNPYTTQWIDLAKNLLGENKKSVLRLTESDLHNILKESVKKILKENREYLWDSVYIVFDGTSYYWVYGCDVEDEIENNEVEVVKGPFASPNEKVEMLIDKLNDEANGVKYDRRYQKNYY